MEAYSGPERRRYVRINESLLLSYAPIDASHEPVHTSAKNISGGGLKIPLKDKFVVGTFLKLELELLKEKKKRNLQAKVVWIRPNSEKDKEEFPYEGGIEFVNLDPEERNMLGNYFQYLNRTELLREFFALRKKEEK